MVFLGINAISSNMKPYLNYNNTGNFEASHLPSEGTGVEWEGVTAGEGMWWLGPLSLVKRGDSFFTVLGDNEAGWGSGMGTDIKPRMNLFVFVLSLYKKVVLSTYCPVQLSS